MEKEKFDPKGEQYKEVGDLPLEHQEEFMDVKGGGFVSREAIINIEKAEGMAHAEENKRKLKEKFDIPPEKIKTLNLSEFIGKRLSEVEKHVIDTYGSNYNIPGDEYLEYLMKNQNEIPTQSTFADGYRYYFLGARDGVWTSYMTREPTESKFRRDASSDTSQWEWNRSVVLIEKQTQENS